MKKKETQKGKTSQNQSGGPPPHFAKIKVVGVGGGGGNAVSRMKTSMNLRGVEYIAINTDAQDLDYCDVRKKIYIGKNLTKGLGTGMNPDLGRQAAEESRAEIADALQGADLVFVTAGFGGGTGSGAGPFVAEIAKEQGALTIGVITKPFSFEGVQRARIAQDAFLKLKEKVDTLISVPNDRVFSVIKKDTPLLKAFEYIDGILRNAVEGVAELIASPGIVNLDFADVKAVMGNAGIALVGMGVAGGQDRALHAVQSAVNSPLLEVSLEGAKGVLLGISGGRDMRMAEINEVAKIVASAVDPSAKIIFGAYHDRRLRLGQLKVTVVATGFDGNIVRESDAMPTLFTHDRKGEIEERKEMKREEEPLKLPERKTGATTLSPKTAESEKDSWDIPTFLRKKRRS